MLKRPRITPKTQAKAELSEAQRRYVERAIAQDPQRRPASRIATDGGLNHTTLTEFLKTPGKVLDALTIRTIAEVTGIQPSADVTGGFGTGFGEEDATPFDHKQDGVDARVAATVELFLKGKPNAAPKILRTKALEKDGFRAGDIVIFEQDVTPRVGDLVQAQVYDHDAGGAHTVYRLLGRAGTLDLLMPTHGTSEETLLVDNRSVKLMAVGTATLRTRS
ncbi:S24 family peptidase [Pseudorhodoplanes sinuspersici]|nr:S24 family peptidase [Pseudorhodoplanes sinuspersici]